MRYQRGGSDFMGRGMSEWLPRRATRSSEGGTGLVGNN